MANTGTFIYNVFFIDDGTTSANITVPIENATASLLVELAVAAGIVGFTIDQAQFLLDTRFVENSPQCLPVCNSILQPKEYNASIVKDGQVGTSWYAIINGIKVCQTVIISNV